MVSTPLKNMKVSWYDYSQYMESHKSHVPNHQSDIYIYTWRILEESTFQWPFQDPKLEVPTIYKAYVRENSHWTFHKNPSHDFLNRALRSLSGHLTVVRFLGNGRGAEAEPAQDEGTEEGHQAARGIDHVGLGEQTMERCG